MNSDIREWEFRYYVADSLRMIPQNGYYTRTLRDQLKPVREEKRTVEEITADICKRAGIREKKPTTK